MARSATQCHSVIYIMHSCPSCKIDRPSRDDYCLIQDAAATPARPRPTNLGRRPSRRRAQAPHRPPRSGPRPAPRSVRDLADPRRAAHLAVGAPAAPGDDVPRDPPRARAGVPDRGVSRRPHVDPEQPPAPHHRGEPPRCAAPRHQSLAITAARAINRAAGRRGKVFAFRYHATRITTPRQMRNTLAYVLNNWRRHGEDQRSARARAAKIIRTRPRSGSGTGGAPSGSRCHPASPRSPPPTRRAGC